MSSTVLSNGLVISAFPAGPRGWWDRSARAWVALILRSKETWVDVESPDVPWIVGRFSCANEAAVKQLELTLISGSQPVGTGPALRRRRWSVD